MRSGTKFILLLSLTPIPQILPNKDLECCTACMISISIVLASASTEHLILEQAERYAEKIKGSVPCYIFNPGFPLQKSSVSGFFHDSVPRDQLQFPPMFLQEEVQSMIDAVEPPEKRVSRLALLPCEVVWLLSENVVASNCHFKREHDDGNIICFPMFSYHVQTKPSNHQHTQAKSMNLS